MTSVPVTSGDAAAHRRAQVRSADRAGATHRHRPGPSTRLTATVGGLALSGLLVLAPPGRLPSGGMSVPLWWMVAAAFALGATGLALAHRLRAVRADSQAGLERLLKFSACLRDAVGTGAVAHALVSHCLDVLPARRAEVLLARRGASAARCWRAGERVDPAPGWVDLGEMEALLGVPRGLVLPGTSPAGDGLLAARSLREAMVLPLAVGDGLLGVLLVGESTGPVTARYQPGDLRLAQSLGNQATVALRHAHALERLRHDALHDALTGLPNRTEFRARAVEVADEATAGPGTCAVGMLDLDGFKTVNDSLGHLAGDQVLAEVGRRMAALAGEGLTVSRLGGDEFAVLVRGTTEPGRVVESARRVLDVLQEPFVVDAEQVRLTGSLGLALGPRDGLSADQLLRNAAVAMYAAKAGAGGLQVYARGLTDSVDAPLSLAADLRLALARGDLTIAVQPLVDLHTGRLHSVEALARWRHPVLGSVNPETFVQAAERGGLLGELTGLVIEAALRSCRNWLDGGLEVQVAVNLAARSLSDPQLSDSVEAALRRHGVPGRLLCLELTETGVITSPDRALAVLDRLRELGISIAVDDFGTGYSSLAYLKWLSPDQLKIDKSFVQRLRFEPRNEAIVRSIIQLGRNLGVDVVAEGVGDPCTATLLSDLGCTLGQGYLFAEPMPPVDLPDWVIRWMTVPDRDEEPGAGAGPDTPQGEGAARAAETVTLWAGPLHAAVRAVSASGEPPARGTEPVPRQFPEQGRGRPGARVDLTALLTDPSGPVAGPGSPDPAGPPAA